MKDSTKQTTHGLQVLLERFDPDSLLAAEKYYRLLGVLALFIENRMDRVIDSEDLARKALDIVSEKLAGGEKIENIPGYSFGVARNLLNASRRMPVHESIDDQALEIHNSNSAAEESIAKEIEEECRQKCLHSLSPEKRYLITTYYQKGLHSKHYKENLARELNVSLEALGNRISRIKKKLSECRLTCIRATRESTILWQ